MKANRLDYLDFYDKDGDLIKCLICGKWYQRLDSRHLRKHGFTNREYKEEFGILPGTPLVNKKILQAYRENTIKLRKEGIFNVFNKGDTNNPINKCGKQFREFRHPEYREIMSRANIKKTPEQIKILEEIIYHKDKIKKLRDCYKRSKEVTS